MASSDDDAIEQFAADARKRQVRITAVAAIVCFLLGVALTAAILVAGDTSDYDFYGHAGRPYGNWTKLFAVLGIVFAALGVVLGARAYRMIRRRTRR